MRRGPKISDTVTCQNPPYSIPSPTSRERKWRSTFRAIFSSPSLIPVYVFGNSRRSGPRTTHTLYRTLAADAGAVEFVAATPGSTAAVLAESSRETKNCGRGYPCTLQYSISIRSSAQSGGQVEVEKRTYRTVRPC